MRSKIFSGLLILTSLLASHVTSEGIIANVVHVDLTQAVRRADGAGAAAPTCFPSDLITPTANAGPPVDAEVILKGHEGAVNSAAFSSDGTLIVTASSDRTARVWRVDGTGEPITLRGHTASVLSAAFSPGGTRVVTASRDGTVRVWRLDRQVEPLILRGHTDAAESAAFSLDGTRLVSASSDGTARVWRADGSGEPVVLRGKGGLHSAAFTPDAAGSRVVTAGVDGTARIWRADGTGQPIVLRGHRDQVYSAAFNADGTRVITASADKTARVWRLDGPSDPLVLRGHQGAVLSASFGPDPTGDRDRNVEKWTKWPGLPADVITAGEEGTACIWRFDAGSPIVLQHTLRLGAGGVNSAAFSPDGTHVVTAGDDGAARVWRVDGIGIR